MLPLRYAALVACLFLPFSAFADENPPSAGSPDGKRNAVGDGQSIKIVDIATGKTIIQIQAHAAKVTAIGFSPDGKLLVSGSDDKTVRIFDAASGRAILAMKGHQAGITTVAFAPGGKAIISMDKNKKEIKWNPATGEKLP